MTFLNPGDILTTVATAQALNASRNHDIDVGALRFAVLQIDWTTLDTFDNVFTIYGSADGSTWDAYTGSAFTPAAAAGTKVYDIDTRAMGYIRVGYARGTASTGTYVLKIRKEVGVQ